MAEVPSRESERIHGESNLRTFKDGRRVLRAMLRTRFQPGRELWRHRARDLPAHRAAVDDVSAATDEARVVPAQRQVPGPHVQP
jgi:hypothetical protein